MTAAAAVAGKTAHCMTLSHSVLLQALPYTCVSETLWVAVVPSVCSLIHTPLAPCSIAHVFVLCGIIQLVVCSWHRILYWSL